MFGVGLPALDKIPTTLLMTDYINVRKLDRPVTLITWISQLSTVSPTASAERSLMRRNVVWKQNDNLRDGRSDVL